MAARRRRSTSSRSRRGHRGRHRSNSRNRSRNNDRSRNRNDRSRNNGRSPAHHYKRSRSRNDRTRRNRKDSHRRSPPNKRRSPSRSNRRRRSTSKNRSSRRKPSVDSACVSNEDLPGLVKYKKGDIIHDRYKILELAGQGTFGTALYVYDKHRKEEVAMKVIRSVERYLEDAQVEIDILNKLTDGDPDRKNGIVRLHTSFTTRIRGRRHVCMILGKLGKSLCDVIEKNNLRGFTLSQVRDFGRHMFGAVAYCHAHKLTHTDLKPENILLCDEVYDTPDGQGWRISSTDTRLIDFGGATYEDEYHASMINTRQYRAPEVMLGLGWSHPSDVWSGACVLPELLTGTPLFQTHQDKEHFALMEKILGESLDPAIALKSLDVYARSDRRHTSRSASRDRSPEERGRSPSVVPIDRIFNNSGKLKWPDKASDSSLARVQRARSLHEQFHNKHFEDFLSKCLVYDPSKRLTAAAALKHPFFVEPLEEP